MECKEFYFKGKEDLDIHVYKWSDKNIEPKAVVQIAHGMSETAIRYKEFAEKLKSISKLNPDEGRIAFIYNDKKGKYFVILSTRTLSDLVGV